jgi:pilus assembly protein CpaC
MAMTTPIRTAALASLVIAAWLIPWQAGVAGDGVENGPPSQSIQVSSTELGSRSISLGVSKSMVVDFPRDIKDVLIADPKIANAVVRSARRAYIIGIKQGQTNIFFFDAQGRQLAGFDLAVTRNLNGIRTALKQIMPDSDIRVEGIGDGIVLSGVVSSQAEAQQAYDIATRLAESGGDGGAAGGAAVAEGKIVNNIIVRGRDQIMLKVTVAEVERDVVKQLGISLSGSLGYGTNVVNFNNSNPFAAYGQPLTSSSIAGTIKSVTATLQAMEQVGVIHTLAEPNLTAVSGETATFMAGGEFPVLNGFSCSSATAGAQSTCQPSISFKKFGVSLSFTPVVLSEGRISLKVMTEVSDLSSNNSLTISVPGTTQSATIPSIRTRRADTTVEIPSGGALAMAGMIQDQTKHSITGLPGLMELPVLGPLFKSNDYVNQRTELMILVMPYVVRAVASKDLARPDDGFADPSDPSQVLLGKLNRIYGVGGPANPPPDTYNGKLGFILD